MGWTRYLAILILLFLPFFAADAVRAQFQETVREIVIEGNQRIETGTIRSYLLVQEGDRFNNRRIDQSLKSLFATGLFADVVLQKQADALIVKVVENPVINRIAFEGNLRIEDDLLRPEVTLRPRVVFTRTKVQNDVKRLLDVYRVNGRFGATIEPKVIQLPQNRADIVFEIDEGPLTKVRTIRFVGNREFDDGDLRSVIRTKEAIWYRFFSEVDTYDPDRLTFDRELLRRFYLAEGYADFRVDSAVAELTPDRQAFFITFSVDEGKRYKFGDITLISGIKGLDGAALSDVLAMKKGDWYDNTLVDETIEKLIDAVGNRGFAFVDVRPRVNRNKETQEIAIAFEVREGPRVFVERIDISGNVRTVDKVIRREFKLVEGDAFNASKLRRSRQRIQDLNFFERVNVDREQGSSPDKAIIKVDVQEKSTGSLNFGVGYSTDAGPLFDISVAERNLLGKGQRLSLATTIAAERSTINLSFTEPYFLDRDIAAGFDVFHLRRNLQDTSSYNSRETGFGLRAGYPLAEFLRQSWKYRLNYSEIEDVSSNAATLIKAQEGERYVSLVGHTLTLDKRDSRVNPTKGFITRLTNEVAGLGGNARFFRNELGAAQYYPLAKEWILSLSGKAGHILGLGEDVEIPDRFFVGGDSLRGFAPSGIGPRDKLSKDALGGEWMYSGSLQLKMPLGLPEELGVSGRIFSDFGSLGTVNPSDANVFDEASIRASVGAGVGWNSPFGPINIDFGFPVLKESLDETETIRVNFGTRF